VAHILALDQGTTSSRAIVFDDSGAIRAVAQREFQQIFPKPGWVEHDPDEIWESQLATAREALSQAGLGAGDVAALGITNQRETVVVWDRRTGRPLHNAIVWQDRRTAEDCDRLRHSGHLPSFRRKTGLVLDPYFSGTKLAWLLRNVPDVRTAAADGRLAFGTVDSWLIWNLTGGAVHATDVTNASRTLLFNIHGERWDEELLAALEVPAAILPEVRSSSEVYGETDPDLFGGPIRIAGVAGDQQAALFGQACLRTGMAKCTYGTGCFLLMNTGRTAIRSKHELLTSPAWRLRGDRGQTDFCLEGSVFVGGAAVQWLRDGLGILKTSAESEALAESVPDSGGIVLVPAFTGLGAPHWDPYARGVLVGITRGTTAAHLARAALEGIAHQVADVISAMEADSGMAVSEMRADGGAASNNLLMQLQADLAGAPVARPKVTETTALGAAYLAGLAVGVWNSPEDVAAHWQVDRVFEPNRDRGRAEEMRALWQRAVEKAKGWAQVSPSPREGGGEMGEGAGG
jgi:glycerol kinase